MKRHISLFEQALINNGWELHCKRYYGKHKDRVLSYEYRKKYNDNIAFVELRKSDLKILDVGFYGAFYVIDTYTHMCVHDLFNKINKEVREIEYSVKYEKHDLSINEEIELVESINDNE